MININIFGFRRGLILFVVFILIPLSVFGFFMVTGYHYVPVDVTLGSCRMDYTSPSAYEDRVSPLKSEHTFFGDGEILICYGSPSVRDRKIFGELVPYDELWRFGANEPTRFYTTTDLVLGDLEVPKGRYSMYVIPQEREWKFFLSESTLHWGNQISSDVRQHEIGSFTDRSEYNMQFVEDFTIDIRNSEMIVTWEKTMVRIPVKLPEEEEDDSENALQQYIKELAGDTLSTSSD